MKFIFRNPLESLGLLIVLSFLAVSLLYAFNIKTPVSNSYKPVTSDTVRSEDPLRVEILKAGVDINVRNPESTNISVLDSELRLGAVRYPGSGTPGNGNMFIFGHSAEAFFVQNPAFKAFDGIKDLRKGDEVYVYTNSQKHVYKVLNVRLASAQESWVDFSGSKNMLTLSTCNTFGAPQERFVVEADYVRSINI